MSKTKKRKLNVPRAVLVAVLFVAFIFIGVGAGFAVGLMRNLPDLDSDFNPDVTTFIHDKEGEQVARLHGVENRIPVDLDEMPESLKQATIATEDRAFYKHPGINLSAFVRATLANLKAGKIVQGGSTITMQLVENAFFIDNPSRTYGRKLQEAVLSIKMERHYTKDEILEAYLNQIYFGHGAYGVQAASQTYFGKDVSELTLAESAMIAGVTNNPAAFSPYLNEENAKKRRAVVLDNMVEAGMIPASKAEEAKKEPIKLSQATPKKESKYPFFVDAVVLEAEKLLKDKGMSPADLYRAGLHIYTTLDVRVQEKMEEVYADSKNFPKSTDDVPVQSAMVVLDPSTGEVRGIIGGREHTVERGLNRAIQGKRQPGSAIKPVAVYGPALEQGLAPATVIDDVPVTYRGAGKPYSPGNYDGRYRGLITIREAIRWSVNIPAVKVLERIGVDAGYNFAGNLGLSLVPEDKGLSMALGGLTHGISPLELASAYGAFANQGIWIEPHTITKITDQNGNVLVEVKPERKAVMSEETAFMVTDMLRTVVSSGTGTRAQISGHQVAGKTGTTQLPDLPEFRGRKGERDAWFVGYTPELVGVVWLGYDKTTTSHYLRGLYGGTSCGPIWKKVMQDALRHTPSRDIRRPGGIVYASVDAKSGKLPSELTPAEFIISDMFARGTVPSEVSDVWIQADVCPDSNMLPSNFCPQTVQKVFLKRPIPYTGSVKPEDAYLELASGTCNVHGFGGNVQVRVCTDPRHGGELFLANPGGCPDEYVSTMNFAVENMPQVHCGLPDHQSDTPAGGENGNGYSEPGSINLSWSKNGSHITLSWSGPSSGSVIYSVERWTDDRPTRSNVAVTSKTSWRDTKIRAGNVYHYQVTAINTATQQRTHSNEVSIKVISGN